MNLFSGTIWFVAALITGLVAVPLTQDLSAILGASDYCEVGGVRTPYMTTPNGERLSLSMPAGASPATECAAYRSDGSPAANTVVEVNATDTAMTGSRGEIPKSKWEVYDGMMSHRIIAPIAAANSRLMYLHLLALALGIAALLYGSAPPNEE